MISPGYMYIKSQRVMSKLKSSFFRSLMWCLILCVVVCVSLASHFVFIGSYSTVFWKFIVYCVLLYGMIWYLFT